MTVYICQTIAISTHYTVIALQSFKSIFILKNKTLNIFYQFKTKSMNKQNHTVPYPNYNPKSKLRTLKTVKSSYKI